MRFLSAALRPILLHLLILGAAYGVAFSHLEMPRGVAEMLPMLPFLVLALTLGVSYTGKRSRLWFLLLAVGLAYSVVYWLLHNEVERPMALYHWIALLTPINLLFFAFQAEQPMWRLRGLYRWLWLMGVVVLLLLVRHLPEIDLGTALQRLMPAELPWPLNSPLPPALQMLFILAAFIALVRYVISGLTLDMGLFTALLACGLAFHHAPHPIALPLFISAAMLALMLGMVRDNYRMAFVDELTDIAGRRALQEWLITLPEQYSIAMVDVDHFKKFNDTYGHDVGDQVLKMVAKQLSKVSGGGLPARYGGEEFTVVFPGKGVAEAQPFAEVLRDAIEKARFTVRRPDRPEKKPKQKQPPPSSEITVSVTVSIGLAEPSEQHATPEAVMKAADEALYRAKRAGRNRVIT